MRIGSGKRVPRGLLCLVAAAFAFGGVAYGQDSEASRLLKEGIQLLRQGRTQEANAKFRAVLAANPSNEDAYALVRETDYQVFLDMMKARGDAEQVAQRLLALARKTEVEKTRDEAAIRPLVETAINSRDLDQRVQAANQLAAAHGEHAVPYLLPYLGSNDIDVRANAVLALTRIGSDAVTPLAASLGTGNEMQQRNVALLLARIGDDRAGPALLRASQGKGGAAGAAAEACAQMGVKSGFPAAAAYLHLAAQYMLGDPMTVLNFDRSFTVWSVEDGKLVGRDVPRFVYNYELAEQAAYDALAVDPANRDAHAMIALANYAELAAWENLTDEQRTAEAIAPTGKSLETATSLAASAGVDGLLRAFAIATELRMGEAAAKVAEAIPVVAQDMGVEGNNALVAGLTNDDKTIRYAAALALLRIDPPRPFPRSNLVPTIAGEAVAERAVRQVLVIDSDSKNAMNVQRALNDAGFHAVAFTSAPAALSAAKATGGFDAVVVRERLSDLSPFAVLDELGRDFRTSSMVKIVMAAGGDVGTAKAEYDSRGIAGVAPTSADSVGVVNTVREALKDAGGDVARTRANQLSIAASNAIAASCGGAWDLRDAQKGLLDAIGEGADADVQLAALRALASVATADAQGALRGVLAKTENRPENRAAAGMALARAVRGQAPARETFQGLLEAMGDADATVRNAAGAALGASKLTPDQQAEVLRKRRVN